MSAEIKQVIDELGQAFEQFKATNDERVLAILKEHAAPADLVEKQMRIEAALDELGDVKERLAKAEAKANLPPRTIDGETAVPVELYDHEDAFDDWIRSPKDPDTIRALKEAELKARNAIASLPRRIRRRYKNKTSWMEFGKISESDRKKAITITTTGGGNAIPTLIHDRIVEKVYDMSPIRQIANVAMASNENHRFLALDNNATGGWAAAGTSRSETTTPLFQAVTLTYGTAYAYPQVYEEAMDDLAMDVGDLVERVATRVLAAQEGTAFVTGNGTARPTGFLNGAAVSPLTIVSTGDEASPQRAFGSLQYFATGAAAGFLSNPGVLQSPIVDPSAVLINTVYGLKAEYRANAVWVANKATLGVVRKLRDGDGNYLWAVGLAPGQPSTLLGYGVVEAEAMPDLAAGAHPLAFGDFNEGYQIGDIVNTLRITVDDNITAPGFVKFYIRRRVGGNLLNDDAIKAVRCATS